jgi:hypothetical protein
MKVVEVLTTAGNPAISYLEDDAAVTFKLLAVSHPTVVMDTDDAAFVIRKQVAQFGLEGASGLPTIAAEVGKHGVSAHPVAGDGTSAGRVPRSILVRVA